MFGKLEGVVKIKRVIDETNGDYLTVDVVKRNFDLSDKNIEFSWCIDDDNIDHDSVFFDDNFIDGEIKLPINRIIDIARESGLDLDKIIVGCYIYNAENDDDDGLDENEWFKIDLTQGVEEGKEEFEIDLAKGDIDGKIRISDVANDLELNIYEILFYLKEYTGRNFDSAALINEKTYNCILEIVTQKFQVNSFDEYFATADSGKKISISKMAESLHMDPYKIIHIIHMNTSESVGLNSYVSEETYNLVLSIVNKENNSDDICMHLCEQSENNKASKQASNDKVKGIMTDNSKENSIEISNNKDVTTIKGNIYNIISKELAYKDIELSHLPELLEENGISRDSYRGIKAKDLISMNFPQFTIVKRGEVEYITHIDNNEFEEYEKTYSFGYRNDGKYYHLGIIFIVSSKVAQICSQFFNPNSLEMNEELNNEEKRIPDCIYSFEEAGSVSPYLSIPAAKRSKYFFLVRYAVFKEKAYNSILNEYIYQADYSSPLEIIAICNKSDYLCAKIDCNNVHIHGIARTKSEIDDNMPLSIANCFNKEAYTLSDFWKITKDCDSDNWYKYNGLPQMMMQRYLGDKYIYLSNIIYNNKYYTEIIISKELASDSSMDCETAKCADTFHNEENTCVYLIIIPSEGYEYGIINCSCQNCGDEIQIQNKDGANIYLLQKSIKGEDVFDFEHNVYVVCFAIDDLVKNIGSDGSSRYRAKKVNVLYKLGKSINDNSLKLLENPWKITNTRIEICFQYFNTMAENVHADKNTGNINETVEIHNSTANENMVKKFDFQDAELVNNVRGNNNEELEINSYEDDENKPNYRDEDGKIENAEPNLRMIDKSVYNDIWEKYKDKEFEAAFRSSNNEEYYVLDSRNKVTKKEYKKVIYFINDKKNYFGIIADCSENYDYFRIFTRKKLYKKNNWGQGEQEFVKIRKQLVNYKNFDFNNYVYLVCFNNDDVVTGSNPKDRYINKIEIVAPIARRISVPYMWMDKVFFSFSPNTYSSMELVYTINERIIASNFIKNFDFEIVNELDDLFEAGKYYDYLKSPKLSSLLYSTNPQQNKRYNYIYIEKAINCAAKIINTNIDYIRLNQFQKSLFINNSIKDINTRFWHLGQEPDEEILKGYAESLYDSFDRTEGFNEIEKSLSKKYEKYYACGKDKKAVTFDRIVERMIEFCPKIAPFFSVVSAFANSEKAYDTLKVYCNYVTDMRQRYSSAITDNHFSSIIINSIKKIKFKNENEIRNLVTRSTAVFVDSSDYTLLKDEFYTNIPPKYQAGIKLILQIVDPQLEISYDQLLSVFDKSDSKINNENIINVQLIQKAVGYYWKECAISSILPCKLVKLLSWILTYDNNNSFEDSLMYPEYSNFKEEDVNLKLNLLLNCFDFETMLTSFDNYALGSYIINVLVNREDINCKKYSEIWNKKTNEIYEKFKLYLNTMHYNNRIDCLVTIRVFNHDDILSKKLQNDYLEWYLKNSDQEELLDEITFLNRYHAYYVSAGIIEKNRDISCFNNSSEDIEYVIKYGEALAKSCEYEKLEMFFEKLIKSGTNDSKQIICEIIPYLFDNYTFRKCKIVKLANSDIIKSCISDLEKINTNQKDRINSLIALYYFNNELLKTLYLYSLYGDNSKKGYGLFYADFERNVRENYGSVLNDVFGDNNKRSNKFQINPYFLIANSLKICDQRTYYSFINWTSRFTMPDKLENIRNKYHDLLVHGAENNPMAWEKILNSLYRDELKNAWMLCVCSSMIGKSYRKKISDNVKKWISNCFDNKNSLPLNLIPYVLLYISDSEDEDMLNSFCEVLLDQGVLDRIKNRNPFYASYSRSIADYVLFCRDKGKSNYYKPLLRLKENLGEEDLNLINSDLNNNTNLRLAQMCHDYIVKINFEKNRELIMSYKEETLDYVQKEMLVLLKSIYFCDEDNERIHNINKACAKIVAGYPSRSTLLSFDREESSFSFKMSVYSKVYAIFYSDDLYDKYTLPFAYIYKDDDNADYLNLLSFIETCFKAQIEWNDYDDIYFRWRFYKLSVILILKHYDTVVQLSSAIYDQILDEVITLAEKYGLSSFRNSIIDMVSKVKEFIEIQNTTTLYDKDLELLKKQFLYELMFNRIGDFVDQRCSLLIELDHETKELMKTIISLFNFRESNRAFIKATIKLMLTNQFDKAQALQEYLPNEFNKIFIDIECKACAGDFSFARVIDNICNIKDPYHIIPYMMELNYEKPELSHILQPLMFMLQFDFRLYKQMRRSIIYHDSYTENFSKHYDKANFPSASVYYYLCALSSACGSKENVTETKKFFMEYCSSEDDIPDAWRKEAQKLRDYVNEKIEYFVPDRTKYDDSAVGFDNITVSFPELVKNELCNSSNTQVWSLDSKKLWDNYSDRTIKVSDRIIYGTAALLDPSFKNEKIDSRIEKIVSVGITILYEKEKLELTADICFIISVEILSMLKRSNSRMEHEVKYLKNTCDEMLKQDHDFNIWVNYRKEIKTIINSIRYNAICETVLDKYSNFLLSERSNKEKLVELEELCGKFIEFDNEYPNIGNAIKHEISRLESSVRLDIDYENINNEIVDNYVYYRITNIGGKAINLLESEKIRVKWKVGDSERGNDLMLSGVYDLRRGFVTAGRIRLNGKYKIGTRLEVSIKIYYDDELVCAGKNEFVISEIDIKSGVELGINNRYDVTNAVVADLGRENEISEILNSISCNGVTVVYGPSRIGKTSILKKLIDESKRRMQKVVSIVLASEDWFGKNTIYSTMNNSESINGIDYSDNRIVGEKLLIQYPQNSLNQAFSEIPSLSNVENNLGERYETVKNLIVSSLVLDGRNIIEKYSMLNELLEKENVQLWIVFDEFQQVIENWKNINVDCDFYKLIKYASISNQKVFPHIKIVICGSDELVLHMTDRKDNIWSNVLKSTYNTIPIRPFEYEPFKRVMTKDPNIKDVISYCDGAIDTLYNYTKGVVIYARLICNYVLNNISVNAKGAPLRDRLYSADIVSATEKLISPNLDLGDRNNVSDIFASVSKNLDSYTKDILIYMAKWLDRYPDEAVFPREEFEKRLNECNNTDVFVELKNQLDKSLEIAENRNLIQRHDKGYEFTTIFYYYAVLGLSKNSIIEFEKRIFNYDDASVRVEAEDIADYIIEMSDSNQFDLPENYAKVGDKLKENMLDDDKKKFDDKVIKLFGGNNTNIYTERYINGDEIINNNLIQAIFTGDSSSNTFRKAYEILTAGLTGLLSDSQSISLDRLETEKKELLDVNWDQNIVYEKYAEIEESQEDITKPIINKKIGEAIQIAANRDLLNISDDKWKDLLGYKNIEEVHCLRKKLGNYDSYLSIAVVIHNIMEEIYNTVSDVNEKEMETNGNTFDPDQIDFCPVVIMYSKLVEAVLDNYHLGLYSKLNLDWFDGTKNGMGKYLYNIADENYTAPIDWNSENPLPPDNKKSWYIKHIYLVFNSIDLISEATNSDKGLWITHFNNLATVKLLRNRAAHAAQKINKSCLDWLVKSLFQNGELLRIIELSDVDDF